MRLLPLCAWCGGELTDRARRKRAESLLILLDHPHERHRPRYGWHGDCAELDPVAAGALGRTRLRPVAEIVGELGARGPGRVARRKRP